MPKYPSGITHPVEVRHYFLKNLYLPRKHCKPKINFPIPLATGVETKQNQKNATTVKAAFSTSNNSCYYFKSINNPPPKKPWK